MFGGPGDEWPPKLPKDELNQDLENASHRRPSGRAGSRYASKENQADGWPPTLPTDEMNKGLDDLSRPTTVGNDASRPVTRDGALTADSTSPPPTRERPGTGKRRGQADTLGILGVTVGDELLGCQEFIAKTFFSEKHYRTLYNSMQETQHDNEALAAVAKMMERHGAMLTSEDITKLQHLDEAQMVEALVSKMPMTSTNDFESFFLQLQLFVSLATRIRQGLLDGNTEAIEAALSDSSDCESAGYISKMALLKSAAEAQNLEKLYKDWAKEQDEKLGKLLSAREELIASQKRYKAAINKSALQSSQFKARAKVTLTSAALSEDFATSKLIIRAWRDASIHEREAGEVRRKYAAQVEATKQRLQEVKMKQIENVKGVLLRRAAADQTNLLSSCFQAFLSNIEENKRERETEKLAAQMERKLKHYQRTQAKTAQSVLGRMNASSEAGLRSGCFKAWVQCAQYEKAEREKKASLESVKEQMERFKKEKKEKAQAVLDSMSSASDTAVAKEVWYEWCKVSSDIKVQRQREKQLQEAKDRWQNHADHLAKTAFGAIDHLVKGTYSTYDLMYLREALSAWRIDTKLERIMTSQKAKVEGQKNQLSSVQAMFRDFANQLENNMTEGTPRMDNRPPARRSGSRPVSSHEGGLPPRPSSRQRNSQPQNL
eukprot:gnl/MRDRNA2_/MRDRNA2_61578_c0_seq1.p1 gnl/MRDRNA2_/MRDRNA2_61578_c0~~gnl/MRDRNA2_/MRDRNA2_61578_c0_seq1.p1  ORF type:complete len:661 (+),score=178.56 gnl/MRDRNA2_/MRDRNA2_61578_c0_seq1:66-2048(+)